MQWPPERSGWPGCCLAIANPGSASYAVGMDDVCENPPEAIKLSPQLQILVEYCDAFAKDATPVPAALPPCDQMLAAQDAPRFAELCQAHFEQMQSWVQRVDGWIEHSLNVALASEDVPEPVVRHACARLAALDNELAQQRAELKAQSGLAAMRAAAPRLDALCHGWQVQLRTFAAQVVTTLSIEALQARVQRGESLDLQTSLQLHGQHHLAEFRAWCEACRKQAEQRTTSRLDGLMALLLLAGAGLLLWKFGVNGFIYAILMVLGIKLLIFVLRHPLALLLAILGSCAFGS